MCAALTAYPGLPPGRRVGHWANKQAHDFSMGARPAAHFRAPIWPAARRARRTPLFPKRKC